MFTLQPAGVYHSQPYSSAPFTSSASAPTPSRSSSLQAFAQGQKSELAGVRLELEEAQRGGRDAHLRLRGLEGQLLAAQGECSKLNSQVSKMERRAEGYREELQGLQAMHEVLQSEHTAGGQGGVGGTARWRQLWLRLFCGAGCQAARLHP